MMRVPGGERGTRAVLWVAVAGLLACGAAARGQSAADEECLACHDVDPAALAESVHGGVLACVDCHEGALPEEDHPGILAAAECAACHPDAYDELAASVHRTTAERLGDEAACASCHGDPHAVLGPSDPQSPVHPARLPETCGACHSDPATAARFRLMRSQPIEAYKESVHGRAVAEGHAGPACTDCHGAHDIVGASDPSSRVNRRHVAETCGTCHADIAAAYRGSIHGQAAAAGVRESPVCGDCHGEHRILSPRERGSPVYATNIPTMTCGRCHGDVRLAEDFGMEVDAVPAYQDSYHGLAIQAGVSRVAHCASCHGVHDILPSSDPASHIHKDNLAATCGQCHPGAGTRFAITAVHVLPTDREHAVVFWIRRVYSWLIVLLIGGMVLHNALDLQRKARMTPQLRSSPRPQAERMSRDFRIAHALLAGSFIVLVYTGFALVYPRAWWAAPILQWEESAGLRGWLHRVAAVAMLAGGLYHLVHLALSARARACIRRIRPGRQDWRELRLRIAFWLGRRSEPPEPAPFGYPEKLEYLAVVWGTLLMAGTGFVMWFENFFLRWAPKWVSDAATAVHFYEAVLASLAILVWHFYLVMFDPAVYPMDPAWLTGRSVRHRTEESHE